MGNIRQLSNTKRVDVVLLEVELVVRRTALQLSKKTFKGDFWLLQRRKKA